MSLDRDVAATPRLINRPRATSILARAGLDALVVSDPLNVYYATTKVPVLDRMTTAHQSVAVIPADPAKPIAYVGSAFEYYYNVADRGVAEGVALHLVAPGAGDPLRSAGGALMRALDKAPLEAREQRRRERTAAATFHTSIGEGLASVLGSSGLAGGVIGIDSLDSQRWVSEAAGDAAVRDAADIVRHIRLVKTPAELHLLEQAAQANAAAMVGAIHAARELGSLRALRERFFSLAALAGNTPIFMLVDGVMDEAYDERLVEGKGFLVDAVSHRGFYQGDYARTASIGDPGPELRRVTTALALAWGEIKAQLRPGLKFSEIREIGIRTLKDAGYDYTVAFKPHSVGLAHEDQPRTDLQGQPFDLELVEDMVLSVDCPLLDVGVGGTAHLEDLTLITATGSRPIHAADEALILV